MAKGFNRWNRPGTGEAVITLTDLSLNESYDSDDFLTGTDNYVDGVTPGWAKNGSIGSGWTQIEDLGNNGGTLLGVADTEAEQADHPGVLYLFTLDDAANPSYVRISRPIGSANPPGGISTIASSTKGFHWRAVLNAYQIQTGAGGANTSMSMMFGLAANNWNSVDPPGVGFVYSRSMGTPHTTWHAYKGLPLETTDQSNTAITVDTTYHLFEIIHVVSGNSYVFKIDGTQVHSASYDLATDLGTSMLLPYFSLQDLTAGTSPKYMAIDYYDTLVSGLSRY